jgi:hypothetical protein
MRRASEDYGIEAAYARTGSHWRLILDYKKVKDNEYRALVYDPLRGIVETTIRVEGDIMKLALSPKLDRRYYKKREEGIEIYNSDGSTNKLSDMEFLEEYFKESPTPKEVIDFLRRRGRTQNDGYNCGPLVIAAAYAIKEYSENRLELEELEEIILGEPQELDLIEIGKPPDEYSDDIGIMPTEESIEIGTPVSRQTSDEGIEIGSPESIRSSLERKFRRS